MPLLKHTSDDPTIVECADGTRRHVGENDVFECTDSIAKTYLSNYPERFVKADGEKPSDELDVEPEPIYSQSAELVEVTEPVETDDDDDENDVSKLKNKGEVLEAIKAKATERGVELHPDTIAGVEKMQRAEMEAFYNDDTNFDITPDNPSENPDETQNPDETAGNTDDDDENVERISSETIGAIQK